MTQVPETEMEVNSPAAGGGYLFGVPLGGLGWFASLLMGTVSGFAAFFAGTFAGIVGILIYNSATHQTVDLALSYKRIGLPVGAVVMTAALAYLGTLWVKRQMRHG